MSQLKAIEVLDISVDQIRPSPYQPRLYFDIESLVTSIEQDGMVSIPVVRRKPDGSTEYELVDGERRLRSVEKLGWETIPVQVVDIDDETTRRIVFTLNEEREPYNVEEYTKFFRRMYDEMKSFRKVAKAYSKSHSTIIDYVNVSILPEPLQKAVWAREIYMNAISELEPIFSEAKNEAGGVVGADHYSNSQAYQHIVASLEEELKKEKKARASSEQFGERYVDPYLEKLGEERIRRVKEEAEKIIPKEVDVKVDLESPNGLRQAAKALLEEAERLKTPEQIEAEKLEKKRGQARNALLTGRGNVKSKIEAAKEEGIDTSEFEKRLEEIEAKILTNPDEVILESKELKNKIDETRNEIRERAYAKKDIENKIRRALDLGIEVSIYKQRLADLVASDKIKDEKESFIEEIDGAIYSEEVKREKEIIRRDAQAEVDRDSLEDVVISDPEEAERILIWQSTEGLTEEDRKSLVTKAETMGWSPKSLAKITKTLIDMDPNNIELILTEDSSIGQSEIIEIGTLKDPELQKTIIEYLQNVDLGTRRSLRVIERAKNKDYAWEDLASRSEDPKPGAPTGLNYRLLRRIERTFYNIRAIGVPSMGIMGPKLWKEAQIYIRGQMDWCRFLLSLNPEVSEEKQPLLPDMSYISVDDVRVKIIEAEYSVVDESKNS